jgi:DNA polymerase III delta subunit
MRVRGFLFPKLANWLLLAAICAPLPGVACRSADPDLEAMVADTSETMVWSLSDAVVAGQPGFAMRLAERLTAQGESLPGVVYGVAGRLRRAHRAACELEAGRPPREVQGSLGMSPYAAKMLVQSVRGTSPEEIRAATCALADLEWWSRGGAEYGDATALRLAVRRAARSSGR